LGLHRGIELDDTLALLIAWAKSRDDVRAILLTSTRASPGGKVDELSDYDVILVTREITPYWNDRSWIGDFGEVLVAYWDPISEDPETGHSQTGNIVQYADGLKIDFTVWPRDQIEAIVRLPRLPAELDAGYVILLDKDGFTAGLSAPTFTAYIPERPDEATFLANIDGFFVGVPYVAKCLLRDELLPAKWCLDYDMRDVYLRPMLEWLMEIDHNWSTPIGALGKGLKRRLSPEIWRALEATYAGAGIGENWTSLFSLIAFYGRIARAVAEGLGYSYPETLDLRVTEFARSMQLRTAPTQESG
jgi:aminoglycoside 6-adenylyltransferase